jgi:hypothetical protein
MTVVTLSSDETAAVLRWVPHLYADRKDIYGASPTTMRVQFHSDDARDVATAQLVMATREMKDAATAGPWQSPPSIILRDLETLVRVIGRLCGLDDKQLDEARTIADTIVDTLRSPKGAKH